MLYMIFVSFCSDNAVFNVKLADACRACLGVFTCAVVFLAVARVIEGVIFTVDLDDAVMADTFFVVVAEHDGLEFAVIGHLYVIDLREILLACLCAGIGNVISIVRECAAAEHHVLPFTLGEPERSFHSVPRTVFAHTGDLFIIRRNDDFLADIGRCERVDQLIDENACSNSLAVLVVLRIPEEKSRIGLDYVGVDGEALIKTGDIFKRTKGLIRATDVHMLEHTRNVIRKIDIIFSLQLDDAGRPVFIGRMMPSYFHSPVRESEEYAWMPSTPVL